MTAAKPARHQYKTLFITALLALIADQLAKWMIASRLPQIWSVEVIPGLLNLVHVRNRGAAFGFLNRADIDWQIWLFAGATILAAVMIFSLLKSSSGRNHWLPFALGLVLGGAAGNLIDRLRFHAVIDFLDFHIGDWHWPAFNVADTAICCGAILACFILWRPPSSSRSGKEGKR